MSALTGGRNDFRDNRQAEEALTVDVSNRELQQYLFAQLSRSAARKRRKLVVSTATARYLATGFATAA